MAATRCLAAHLLETGDTVVLTRGEDPMAPGYHVTAEAADRLQTEQVTATIIEVAHRPVYSRFVVTVDGDEHLVTIYLTDRELP